MSLNVCVKVVDFEKPTFVVSVSNIDMVSFVDDNSRWLYL